MGSGELYTLDDIDFLAAYVIARDLWYVVPAEAFVPRVPLHGNGAEVRSVSEEVRSWWLLTKTF